MLPRVTNSVHGHWQRKQKMECMGLMIKKSHDSGHLLKLVLLVILNSPSRLLKDTSIVYIMSDWRLIVSTVVSILSCDPSNNVILVKVVTSVELVINISIVVGYSPGHSLLTYRSIWSTCYYLVHSTIHCLHKHVIMIIVNWDYVWCINYSFTYIHKYCYFYHVTNHYWLNDYWYTGWRDW